MTLIELKKYIHEKVDECNDGELLEMVDWMLKQPEKALQIYNDPLLERITFTPDIRGNRPSIRSQRFLVKDILELISSGMTEADILEQHPILEKEDIQAALLFS